jgi:hypothetical protein
MDTKKIEVLEIEGVEMVDYPDFCDAYIEKANYNGVEMTDEQLDEINQDSYFVYDAVMAKLF